MLSSKTTEVVGLATAAAIGVGIGYAIGKNRAWKMNPEAFQNLIEKHNGYNTEKEAKAEAKKKAEAKADKKAKKEEVPA